MSLSQIWCKTSLVFQAVELVMDVKNLFSFSRFISISTPLKLGSSSFNTVYYHSQSSQFLLKRQDDSFWYIMWPADEENMFPLFVFFANIPFSIANRSTTYEHCNIWEFLWNWNVSTWHIFYFQFQCEQSQGYQKHLVSCAKL